jgi:hypothetical protein
LLIGHALDLAGQSQSKTLPLCRDAFDYEDQAVAYLIDAKERKAAGDNESER